MAEQLQLTLNGTFNKGTSVIYVVDGYSLGDGNSIFIVLVNCPRV